MKHEPGTYWHLLNPAPIPMEEDARSTIEAELRPGETRILRVTLNPYSEKLTLAWGE